MRMLDMEAGTKISRVEYQFSTGGERFLMKGLRNFKDQYAQFYHVRLKNTKNILEKSATSKWGESVPIRKLGELNDGELACIIGILYKESELKPNILKELAEAMEDSEITEQPILPRYTKEDDTLVMEENNQRIVLGGNIDIQKLCTGCTIAILGQEDDRGLFNVKDICFAGLPPQPEWPVLNADTYIAFISGLDLGTDPSMMMKIDLCIQMLTGQLGTRAQLEKMAKVAAVIIAGGLIAVEESNRIDHSQKALFLTRNVKVSTVDTMRTADDVIMQLTACMDVYLMPGANDPGCYLMPQQPLHPCLLPRSNHSTGLHLVTNPFEADFNGIRILGTSGQNVTDIYKNTTIDDPLEIIELTLNLRHMCPTAPDTLDCCPETESDPFIMKETPHVYFAGNQTALRSKNLTGQEGQRVTLLAIPAFSSSPVLTLLNLRTMNVESIEFEDAVHSRRGIVKSDRFSHVNAI